MPTGAEKISQELKDFGQHSHGLCLWLAHQLLAVTAFDKSKTSELSRLSELIIKTNEKIKSETAKAIALTKELNDLDKKVEGLDKTLELKYREGKEGSCFCNEKGQLTELDK